MVKSTALRGRAEARLQIPGAVNGDSSRNFFLRVADGAKGWFAEKKVEVCSV